MADDFYGNLRAIVGSEHMTKVKETLVVDWSVVSESVYEIVEEEITTELAPVPATRINRDALLAGLLYTPQNATAQVQPGYEVYSYGICFGKNLYKECENDDTPLFYSYNVYTMSRGTTLYWHAFTWETADEAEKAELVRTAKADLEARNAHAGPGIPHLTKLLRIENEYTILNYFPQNGTGQRLLVLTTDGDRVPLPVYLERFPVILQTNTPQVARSRCLYTNNDDEWTDYQTFSHVKATLIDQLTDLSAIQIMISAMGCYYKRDGLTVALAGFH